MINEDSTWNIDFWILDKKTLLIVNCSLRKGLLVISSSYLLLSVALRQPFF
jgi:hypothetical protein